MNILIIEDDRTISGLMGRTLTGAGYECGFAYDGEEAEELFDSHPWDLVLLDLMLPKVSGYDLLEYIAPSKTPVIIVSAMGQVNDRIRGLKMGADDYIMKPFDSNELVARVNAVLRRASAAPSEDEVEDENVSVGKVNYDRDGEFVEYDNLIVNISHYTVTLEGHHVEMPPKELELLYFMASRPNQVFTREQLLNQLWGYEFMGDTRTVDVHVKRLREKLSDKYNWTIATVWRIGYKFEVR